MAVACCGAGLPRALQKAWRKGISAGNRPDNPRQESSPGCWVTEQGGDLGLLLKCLQKRKSGQMMLASLP